jgi:4a-hydroxytetrahydrobiopterin dehydratase
MFRLKGAIATAPPRMELGFIDDRGHYPSVRETDKDSLAPNRRDVADLLEEEEIEQRTDELGDWEREGNAAIQKVFEFEDFTAAIKFVNEVAKLADRYDHHPDIDIRWNRVKLVLSTHSEGGLTARDFDVAGEIEQSIQD